MNGLLLPKAFTPPTMVANSSLSAEVISLTFFFSNLQYYRVCKLHATRFFRQYTFCLLSEIFLVGFANSQKTLRCNRMKSPCSGT